jgi:hypothetical protein
MRRTRSPDPGRPLLGLAAGLALGIAAACARDTSAGRTSASDSLVPNAPLTAEDTAGLIPWARRRQAYLRASTGGLVGRITDAETGRPIEGVSIGTRSMGGYSDEWGRYEVVYLDPGEHRVEIERRGYAPQYRTITAVAGSKRILHASLRRAAPVRLRLDGSWAARFELLDVGSDSARKARRPTGSTVAGTLWFSRDAPPPLLDVPVERDRYVWTVFGRSELDFSPFFGGAVAEDVSTTLIGPVNDSFTREVVATVFDGDSVLVSLVPRISHGGVSFAGRLHGDSIVGRWDERAYCCGASGRVVLRRTGGSR